MIPPITFNNIFEIDQENKWYIEGVYLNAEQRAVCGNVVIKASLDGMGPSVDIMIKKSNTKPAFVTMEVKVYVNSTRGKWMRKDFKDWTDTCSINNIPVHVDQLIRKGLYVDVNVELKIYWHGHIANQISPNLFDNIKDYMNKPEFSDVTVCVKGEKKYLAHKIILAAQSPMLEKMLMNMKKTEKNCICFSGIDDNVADQLMMFLYQGKLVQTKKNSEIVLKLFEFGIKYQIQNLADSCGFILSDMINIKNALKNFELATANNSSILRQSSLTFILNNYEKIKKSNEFGNFSKRNPQLLSEIHNKLEQLENSDSDESD
ncbi:TD and POZ domain-containing protein 3-like [Cotesia glomerata]|uniref:TD and POZ domain-containing protein 3-like n=1 Tax=Cotesia glomerata TaxID=32391 RepID=UPI001D0094FD|nr:TD and POZ domain-containing protein 3-like [Cotesia glomerata]